MNVNKHVLQGMAAAGALGVCVVLLALLALVILISLPGGIDTTEAFITWVSVGIMIVLMVAGHLVYARTLFRASRGRRFGL
ncbi:MAG: hypothetical protein ACREOJ_00170 [Gemmatimonadaceae bacterium]